MDNNIKFSLIIDKLNQKISDLNIKVSNNPQDFETKKELETLLQDRELFYKGDSEDLQNLIKKYGELING